MADDPRPSVPPIGPMTRHPDAPDIGNLSRRGFIGAAAGSAALAAMVARAEAQVPAPPPLEEVRTEYFTAREWPLVLALCDTLIPAGPDGPGALEARVPVFIDRQAAGFWGQGDWWYMEGPHEPGADPTLGFQSPLNMAQIHRQGLAHFDEWCRRTQGGAFTALDAPGRNAAVGALMEGRTGLPDELRDFPAFFLTSVKQGYLSDPRHGGNHAMLAWVHVGFPGARANFLSWTDPARDGTPYPLGPVSINGERA